MRLLNTQSIVVESFNDDQIPLYAILSHTWEAEEVIFQDMELGKAAGKKGWSKLKGSCSMARKNGFDYIWIDTCCIDKTSSAELSESINSMYRWYQEAAVCYAYLADVSGPAELSGSKWFTRGWTLQELIAPSSITFFSQTWKDLGTRETLDEAISERTGIPKAVLSGNRDLELEKASVAQRMSWAAERRTTRREDLAYCLMGLFGINMPLLYGEGERAFIRLQEEIMRVSDDHSLFAWKHPSSRGGLLAPSPAAFKDSGNIIPWNPFMPYNAPFTLTNKGVHLDLPFIGLGDQGVGLAILSCTEIGQQDKLVAIYLRDAFLTMEHFERCRSGQYDLVDLLKFRPAQYPTRSLCITLRGPSQRSKEAPGNKAYEESKGGKTGNGTEQDDQTQLSLAAAHGREADVKRLLALPKVRANLEDGNGDTPLSLAASAGHEGVVRLLLDQHHVDINSKNKASPITRAIDQGHEGVVWQLLARSDIFRIPQALVSRAARRGHETLLGQLLARRDIREHLKGQDYASCLCAAADAGHESVVRLLLGSGKVHPDQKDPEGNTALLFAIKSGRDAIVKMLLETSRVDPRCRDNDKFPVLGHAASGGREEIVRLLLDHGSGMSEKHGWLDVALMEAASNGHESIVKLLLDHGAIACAVKDLDLPIKHWRCSMANELLANEVEIDKKDYGNHTPLMEAAWNGHEGIVQLLLDYGATASAVEALDLAAERGNIGVVKELLAHGVEMDGEDHTPLMKAALNGHEGIVKLLLDHATTAGGLRIVAKKDRVGIVKRLFDKMPPSKSKNALIFSLLQKPIEHGHFDTVEALLKQTEKPHEVIRQFHLSAANKNRDERMARLLYSCQLKEHCEGDEGLFFRYFLNKECKKAVEGWLPGPGEKG